MRLEIPLTILSLLLMGGNMFLPWAPAHEVIGVALMVVWGVHIYANRRWFKATFRGRYNPFRITQAVVNYGMIICVVFLAVSGVMLSNHLFAFLGIESGASFARKAHLLASHWYFVFISLHIGMHVGVIYNRLKFALLLEWTRGSAFALWKVVATRFIVALVSVYGIYAFVERGLWKYLTLQQPFFFMDMERGYILFFVDYISILALFATAMHYAAKFLIKHK